MMKKCGRLIAYLVRGIAGTSLGSLSGYLAVCCLPFLEPYYDCVIPLFMSVGMSVCMLKKYRSNLLVTIGVNFACASLWSVSFLAGIGAYSIPVACRRLLVYNLDVDFALYTVFLIKRAVRSLFEETDGRKDAPAENEDI